MINKITANKDPLIGVYFDAPTSIKRKCIIACAKVNTSIKAILTEKMIEFTKEVDEIEKTKGFQQ